MLNFNIGVFITNSVRDRREKPTAKRGLVAIARPSLRGHEQTGNAQVISRNGWL
jgi:hypothetical protein